MKKIITIFILFTAFIACCFAAVSCKSSRAVGGHKHELVTVKAKAVTCTEEGWNEYVYCITEGCGYTTKNVKKALGHNMEEIPEKPATCTEDGYTAYGRCTREGCGYTIEKQVIEATGHTLKQVAAKAASCDTDGHSAYTYCANENCDFTKGKTVYPRAGHLLKLQKGEKSNCMRSGYGDYEYCQRTGCSFTTKTDVKATASKHYIVNGECTECGFTVNDLADFFVDVANGKEPVILQLTDPQTIDSSQDRTGRLHASEKAFYAPQNVKANCYDYITETITKTNPDLIIMTGDLVYGEFDDNGTIFEAFVEFMESFGIPWAPVMGNHEGTSAKGVDWQCELLENAEHCLFKQRSLTGNGNYSVAIRSGGVIRRVFYMVDTNGCGDLHENSLVNKHTTSAVGLAEDQINWVTERAKEFREYCGAPVSIACHIQPEVFSDALSKYGFPGNVPINIYKAENRAVGDFGYLGRAMKGTWDGSKRFFNLMKSLGMDSMFVGHEHNNCGSVTYQGVRLQYGQKSSAYDRFNGVDPETLAIDGSYAPKASNIVPLIGGTVIPLGTDGSLKTPYIFLCENAGGNIDWDKKFIDVEGLKIGNGLSAESGIKVEAVEYDGVNAYKITANEQGKIIISAGLLANKSKVSFSIFMPETSTAKLSGYGEFSVRVKPNSLVNGGYILFSSDLTDDNRKIVFGEWKTYEVDVSAYGSECSEFSIILAKGNVMYLRNVVIE